jgi:hypothetical protein
MAHPPAPALGNLRLATINDVPRIGIVAVASFFYTSLFPWQLVHHREYPEDTLQAYEKMFADSIRDPGCVVLVSEDEYQSDEHTKTGAVIAGNTDGNARKQGELVIVGVVVWALQPGSKRVGEFMNQDDLSNSTVFDGGLRRDREPSKSALLWETIGAEQEKSHFLVHNYVDEIANCSQISARAYGS